jgi:hypothetical protein
MFAFMMHMNINDIAYNLPDSMPIFYYDCDCIILSCLSLILLTFAIDLRLY